jgi:hypothetical protein
VSQILAALEGVMKAYPNDDASGWIRWLTVLDVMR